SSSCSSCSSSCLLSKNHFLVQSLVFLKSLASSRSQFLYALGEVDSVLLPSFCPVAWHSPWLFLSLCSSKVNGRLSLSYHTSRYIGMMTL
ncbi:hypothetical protein DL95DRAFT_504032, partial [Leptodontidium sp. 2 PMI_412]